jgi:hypothetical protein
MEKKRLGVDAQLYLDLLPVGGSGVKAEYYLAKDRGLKEDGWYLWLSQVITTKFGAAVRYDYFDPNTSESAKNDATGTWSLAFHYFWDSYVRITAAYDIPRQLKDNSLFSKHTGDLNDNRFTLQFQFSL